MKYARMGKTNRVRARFVSVAAVLFAGILLLGGQYWPSVHADRFDEQINALKEKNQQVQSNITELEAQADSFEAKIAQLRSEIAGLQAQITQNIAKQRDLTQQIRDNELEIARQRSVLKADIRAMYVNGHMSTVEMLASSRDLNDYVNAETYRTAVQNNIQKALDEIAALQKKLGAQKQEVGQLLAAQRSQQNELTARRNEQTALLAYNEQQRSDYSSQLKKNNKRIAELRYQQELANIALFSGGIQAGVRGGGGYPWGNAYCVYTNSPNGRCYNYDWYFNGSPWDPWGYGYRNCTSWVAYKLAATGHTNFSYLGNAKQWPNGVPSSWVKYGSGAKAGDAAVSTSGTYGHVMYVEGVLDDGRVMISDYNRAGDGLYRGPTPRDQAGLVFITFPSR